MVPIVHAPSHFCWRGSKIDRWDKRRVTALIQSSNFGEAARTAAAALRGPRAGPAEQAARIALWRQQEWHGWFRWWLCARGTDWSKPVWIGLLVAGFGGLALYGQATGRWFVTAGGVVAWFTIINLAFFTYFGLSLPGPPSPVPGPFPPGQRVIATLGIYPAGYERRKLARLRLRIDAEQGAPYLLELAVAKLDPELADLLQRQALTRMQRGDAPATEAVVETLAVSRAQIDSGDAPLKVVAWRWDESAVATFFGK